MKIDQIDVRSRIINVIYYLNLILPSEMGMYSAENLFNMCMF